MAPARTLPVRIDNVKLPMLVHRGGSAMPEVTVRKATPDDGIPAHLESSSIRNQALDYRHGFEVIEELNWPGGGPPFSLMWRKPR